ncbi:unnamed protein product [Dicrocoelium dendriticum]|nr:unnamed protein product [Dicrocoelium dendriticum]
MPAASEQLRRFYVIQRMKEQDVPLPEHLSSLSFEERFQVYKDDRTKFNFPLSYPHWIQSEKLRYHFPTIYTKWLQQCTESQEFQPVPPMSVAKRESTPQEPVAETSPQNLSKRKLEFESTTPAKKPKLTQFIDDMSATPCQPSPSEDFEPVSDKKLADMFQADANAADVPKNTAALDNDTLFETIKAEFNTDNNLWTFIYRGSPTTFIKGTHVNALVIQHSDHYHFVFSSSPNNSNWALKRLLKACSIPETFTFDILTTIQPVIDWSKPAVYHSRTGYTVQLLGTKFQHLADSIALTPAIKGIALPLIESLENSFTQTLIVGNVSIF